MLLAFLSDSFSNQPAPALATVRALGPDGVFLIGDFPHDNPGTNVTNAAGALTKAREYFRRLHEGDHKLGIDYKREILDAGVPILARIMDDHEVKDNVTNNWPYWAQTLEAFLEWYTPPPDNGFALGYQYQALRVGDVEVLLLDLRTHRETDPGPNKTILGLEQKTWLAAKLLAIQADPTVQWTLVVSTVPVNPNQDKKDSWVGFPLDSAWLHAQLAPVPNVLVVSADVHHGSIALPPLVVLPELNVPQLNEGFSNTGNNYPQDWTLNALQAVKGFGTLTLDDLAAVLTIYNADGSINLQTTVARVPLPPPPPDPPPTP